MKKIILLVFILLVSIVHFSFAQQKAKIFGVVKNEKGDAIEDASVLLQNGTGLKTNAEGLFLFEVEADKPYTIYFSYTGFESQMIDFNLKPDEKKQLTVVLKTHAHAIKQLNIVAQQYRVEGMQTVDPKLFDFITNASGSLEAVLKTMGATSNNELSSQYSVRGGNYDENLVYLNDFEIRRPLLVQSSQQEGLSILNPDMVSNLKFSAGGFQAKYGDKLSSVLDITYKIPKKFGGTVSAGLLGQSIELEGCSFNNKFTWMLGFRNKTNQILLASQQTKGEYRPVYNDLQLFTTYQLTKKIELQAFGNLNLNKFELTPQSRVTSFGLVNETVRLQILFDGNEIDRFDNTTCGLAAILHPKENVKLKFQSSFYASQESETFDIIGQYLIGEVQTDITQPNYNQIKYQLGVGTSQDYARNYLNSSVLNFSHLGVVYGKNHTLNWGVSVQAENINDNLKEWHRTDSAGYSLPYSDSVVNVFSYVKTSVILSSLRYSGYLQNTFNFSDTSRFKLNIGARFSYWDVNKEFLITPRAQFTYVPKTWKRDVIFRLGTGFYDQPPFYKELRDFYGNINTSLKAQKSYQVVLGTDYNFKLWKRPFTLTSEAYYKYLWDVVPYEIDNVRIRYYAKNDAVAFATGAYFRMIGEVVKDAQSWISVDFLNTKENLTDDYYVAQLNPEHQKIDPRISSSNQDKTVLKDTIYHPGYVPRPSDQRVNVSLFFSDYIPKHPNLQVHLNLVFGTGLPFGPPNHNRYQDTLRMPTYRRVDIGFSAKIFDGKNAKYKKNWKKNVNTIWATLEIFNLLGVTNTISYTWVKDIYNTTYAVPNYLTARRFNFKLTCKF